MANNLTQTVSNGLLTQLSGGPAFTVTTPLQLALVSANGTATTAGTEVNGGSYARLPIVVGPVANGQMPNAERILFTDLPAVAVVGFEVYDSTATPQRLFWGPATLSRTLLAGDDYEIRAGALVLALT